MLDMQPDDGDGDGDGCDTAREMVSLKYGMQIVYVLAYVCMLSINVWGALCPLRDCIWMDWRWHFSRSRLWMFVDGLGKQSIVAWSALKCECVWECW